MKAAFYGRFSTSMQRETSIADQYRNCQRYAEREGWKIVKRFEDKAISGADKNRPQYQAMLTAAKSNEFDVLITDDLDRLMRDEIEQKITIRRFQFWHIRLIALGNGFDSDSKSAKMISTMSGFQSEQFLDTLKAKTHSGLQGQVERGFSAGAKIFGYKSVPIFDKTKTDTYGNLVMVAAKREVNPEEAKTVKLIFQLFAEGNSPHKIALHLNDEDTPAPRGGRWNEGTIRGNPRNGHGILHNRLLIGEVVWNKSYRIKNPDTGKKKTFYRPTEEWIRKDEPRLRIIDQKLWDKVQRRLVQISSQSSTIRKRLHAHARTGRGPKYLFSSLLKCGVCGASYTIMNKAQAYGCNGHRSKGEKGCGNDLKVNRHKVEERLLAGIKTQLFRPEAIALFKREVTRILKEERLKGQPDKVEVGKQLAQVEKEVDNIVKAIRSGGDFSTTLKKALEMAEAEKGELLGKLNVKTDGLDKIGDILPDAVGRYERLLRNLDKTLQTDVNLARNQIKRILGDKIKMIPVNGHLEAEMAGDFGGLLSLSANGQINHITGGD